jgi:hypothetical protein
LIALYANLQPCIIAEPLPDWFSLNTLNVSVFKISRSCRHFCQTFIKTTIFYARSCSNL